MSLECPAVLSTLAPAMCRAVDHYCERIGPSLGGEPVNAFTNLAFLIGALAAWRLASKSPHPQSWLVRALIVTMAIVGLGSLLFHTVGTRWSEWGDVLPILVFMLLYLWLVLTAYLGWPRRLAGVALAAFFAITFTMEAAVPGTVLWGGALYLPTVLVLVAIGLVLRRRRSEGAATIFTATCVFLVSFAARTLDAPLCPVFPPGTHFAWHLLNALVLYLLVRGAIGRHPG